jgi:hypothetical protein
MSSSKLRVQKVKLGIAALPEQLSAKSTAEAVLTELQRMGAIPAYQTKQYLESITGIVRASNDRNEEMWQSVYATVNATNSNKESKKTSAKMQTQLFVWLDRVVPMHKGNLDQLADKAVSAEVVPRSSTWIRKQITQWKKLQKK